MNGYTYIWIEGEKNLEEFCMKRFKEFPRFVETIGHCGDAHIRRIYKYNDLTGYWSDFFLLVMAVYNKPRNGDTKKYSQIEEILKWDYEQIRADKNSILKPARRSADRA